MHQVNVIKTSYSLLQRNFGLEGNIDFEDNESTNDRLKKMLIRRLDELLAHDFNALLNALYRMDVSEHKVKQVLTLSDQEDLSEDLAEMIIERVLQKAATRLAHAKE